MFTQVFALSFEIIEIELKCRQCILVALGVLSFCRMSHMVETFLNKFLVNPSPQITWKWTTHPEKYSTTKLSHLSAYLKGKDQKWHFRCLKRKSETTCIVQITPLNQGKITLDTHFHHSKMFVFWQFYLFFIFCLVLIV